MWLAFGSRLQNEDTGDVDPIKWSWTCLSSWSVRWWDSGGAQYSLLHTSAPSGAAFKLQNAQLRTSTILLKIASQLPQYSCLNSLWQRNKIGRFFNSTPFLVTWSLYWPIALFGEHLSIITTERRVQECTIRPPWPLNLLDIRLGQKEKNFCHLKHRLILVSILPSAPSSFKLISRAQSERKFCQIRSNGNPKPGT